MNVLLLALLSLYCFSLSSFSFGQSLQARYQPLAADVALELALLEATNAARADNGLGPLQMDETLALAARHHALEMATLNYFSHQSPTAGSDTPPERTANAGSPYIVVGENIAKLQPMQRSQLANATVTGWMNSPGHRANILDTTFTHVGFGLAEDSQGSNYIVQNFSYQPFQFRSAQLQQKSQASYLIVLEVEAPQPTSAVFGYGNQTSQATQLSAGLNQVEFTTTEANQVYLQAAVPSGEANNYIFQDGGWLTLASGRYQADDLTPKTYLTITDAKARIRTGTITELALVFDGAAQKELGVFVNDVYTPNAAIASGTVQLVLTEDTRTIAVGEVIDGNRVNMIMQFALEQRGEKIVLVTKSNTRQ
ncbi:MAG: CAP domain-containing protein [Trueperaceae bacterium]